MVEQQARSYSLPGRPAAPSAGDMADAGALSGAEASQVGR